MVSSVLYLKHFNCWEFLKDENKKDGRMKCRKVIYFAHVLGFLEIKCLFFLLKQKND